MELEDDILFANLSKEIALLIMDEDEDPLAYQPTTNSIQVIYYLHLLKYMHHIITYIFSLPLVIISFSFQS